MCHRLSGLSTYGLKSLRKGDEHPAYAQRWVRHLYRDMHCSRCAGYQTVLQWTTLTWAGLERTKCESHSAGRTLRVNERPVRRDSIHSAWLNVATFTQSFITHSHQCSWVTPGRHRRHQLGIIIVVEAVNRKLFPVPSVTFFQRRSQVFTMRQTRRSGNGSLQRGPGAEYGNPREHQRDRDKNWPTVTGGHAPMPPLATPLLPSFLSFSFLPFPFSFLCFEVAPQIQQDLESAVLSPAENNARSHQTRSLGSEYIKMRLRPSSSLLDSAKRIGIETA